MEQAQKRECVVDELLRERREEAQRDAESHSCPTMTTEQFRARLKLRGERTLQHQADVPKYLRAAKASEVLTKIGERHGMIAAREDLDWMRVLGIETWHDMDADFTEEVAALKADHNVALALRLGADFVATTPDKLESNTLKSFCRTLSNP